MAREILGGDRPISRLLPRGMGQVEVYSVVVQPGESLLQVISEVETYNPSRQRTAIAAFYENDRNRESPFWARSSQWVAVANPNLQDVVFKRTQYVFIEAVATYETHGVD
jgi:hypothetical protein